MTRKSRELDKSWQKVLDTHTKWPKFARTAAPVAAAPKPVKVLEPTRKASYTPHGGTAKPAQVYTGTDVIGISVVHKSCLQPVFSQEQAEDFAKMRRG